MCECVVQLLWMMHTLKDYRLNHKNVKVLCDNVNTINLIKNLVHHSGIKYIKVKQRFVQDHIIEKILYLTM